MFLGTFKLDGKLTDLFHNSNAILKILSIDFCGNINLDPSFENVLKCELSLIQLFWEPDYRHFKLKDFPKLPGSD